MPGESFWLPFDALSAMTVVPNSTISCIQFSIRTRESLPHQGGYVEMTPLLIAGLDKLHSPTISEQAQQRLLSVMQDELLEASLHTDLSEESKSINTYLSALTENKTTSGYSVSPDMMMTLKVREADKMRKSGAKNDMIAARYFSGNIDFLLQASSILA
jgi:hypothetical protein